MQEKHFIVIVTDKSVADKSYQKLWLYDKNYQTLRIVVLKKLKMAF